MTESIPAGMAPARKPAMDPGKDAAIARAAKEFEAVFLGMAVNEMIKETMPSEMNGGRGEEMFRSFLGNEIGAVLAEDGGIGIARSVAASMKAYQQ